MIERTSLQETAARLFGLALDRRQVEAFAWYAAELMEWNRRFNLTAVDEPAGIETKHFLDSLSCLRAMGPRPRGRLADVGSGAGFPGIPLKIALPELDVTLVEATGKKADFCRHVVEGLGLRRTRVLQARAEEAGRMPEHREAYDYAVARAVAALPTLVEYLVPLLKIKGTAIAQKGESGPAEAQAAEEGLRLLGGRVLQVIPVNLPRVAETRYLIVMEKVSATPDKYPRRPGMAARRPLG